jgi:hypothetical protein
MSRKTNVAAAVLLVALCGSIAAIALSRGGNLESAGPSTVPHKGWILHVQRVGRAVPFAGAGHFSTYKWDTYTETGAPYRTRMVGSTWVGAPEANLEQGRAGGESFVFDPKTKTIYSQQRDADDQGFDDPAAANRERVKSGEWKIAARTTLDGRSVLKITNVVPRSVYYLDATTYVLVRLESPGNPLRQAGGAKRSLCDSVQTGSQYPDTTSVIDTTVYEYLPPTTENEKLVDVDDVHPGAISKPAASMPTRLREQVAPPNCFGIRR